MEQRSTIRPKVPSIAQAMREVRTKRQLAELLGYLRIKPSRSLGQNFLVDHNLLDFVVRAAEVGPGDVVLDIGCGTGLLTAHLADAAGHVVGIELHRGLFAVCSRYLEGRGNVTLLCGDALESKHALSPALLEAVGQAVGSAECGVRSAESNPKSEIRNPKSGTRALRVVSNLPYSAASLIVPNLLESGLPIAVMVVTVQKEVAERMAAGPGSGDYGALSLVVQAQAAVEVLRAVPPEVFWPRPKVASSIVRLVPDAQRKAAVRDFAAFREVVKAAFAHRRKTLANSLGAGHLLPGPVAPLLSACGIEPSARAQEVDLARYILLANHVSDLRSAR
ncbi:MAG: 16S rRNA (adenine(1518)-N(6)/adenine(1519)-N(6))-dimethyltransferase [Planctomycetes bacterium]|nr:16S rRNA (adenine(1518)-N(6)/adenine(1519)-N(6))-dimethyltransferase [Planctomycetota bacterium]